MHTRSLLSSLDYTRRSCLITKALAKKHAGNRVYGVYWIYATFRKGSKIFGRVEYTVMAIWLKKRATWLGKHAMADWLAKEHSSAVYSFWQPALRQLWFLLVSLQWKKPWPLVVLAGADCMGPRSDPTNFLELLELPEPVWQTWRFLSALDELDLVLHPLAELWLAHVPWIHMEYMAENLALPKALVYKAHQKMQFGSHWGEAC